jgi:hypothetical protein
VRILLSLVTFQSLSAHLERVSATVLGR